jgi:hypothetical protein
VPGAPGVKIACGSDVLLNQEIEEPAPAIDQAPVPLAGVFAINVLGSFVQIVKSMPALEGVGGLSTTTVILPELVLQHPVLIF